MPEGMRMLEIVGLVLLVQGVGGLLNHWLDGDASWYVVNHVDALAGWEVPVNALFVVAGLLLGALGERRRRARAT